MANVAKLKRISGGAELPAAPFPVPSSAQETDPMLDSLESRLSSLRSEILSFEQKFSAQRKSLHAEFQASASNLLHYIELRRHDLRVLQEQLTLLGLSSLGRAEPDVLAGLNAVLSVLARLRQGGAEPGRTDMPGARSGQALAARHAEALLGREPAGRRVRIMVTLPEEAAEDGALVRSLLAAGMESARINCAHGNAAEWRRMVENVRAASAQLRRPCKVLMDLGGPKLRTAALRPGHQVIRWRPERNELGQVVSPARIWLSAPEGAQAPPVPVQASLPVLENWQNNLHVGDRVLFHDARGRLRKLKIVQEVGAGRLAVCSQTAYVVPDTRLRIKLRKGRRGAKPAPALLGRVGALPALARSLVLRKGDEVLLTLPDVLGEQAVRDARQRVAQPAHIGCTLPEVLRDLRAGERIMFDDGKISGVITSATPRQATVKITRARSRGSRLEADKGINLPDSALHLAALTPKDLADLAEIVQHADAVGYSFVRRPEDIHRLQAELERLGALRLGVLLKIENRQAFEQLPSLLLALMRSPVAGVMIARGDLAIEIGYERLAEVQEEILWMCEAAHMPVVWATQVLETLAKEGVPSRAEITDAAMGVRAECVMLNKGPYIVETIRALDNILKRMQEHHRKKREMLRKLKLAEGIR